MDGLIRPISPNPLMMNDISSKKAECMFGVNVEAAIFFKEVVVEEAAQQG